MISPVRQDRVSSGNTDTSDAAKNTTFGACLFILLRSCTKKKFTIIAWYSGFLVYSVNMFLRVLSFNLSRVKKKNHLASAGVISSSSP